MRELKFRGYDKGGNGFTTFSIFGVNPPLKRDSFKAVCQYTGLKDKTGKEIYEDDVVSFVEENEQYTREIEYYEGCFTVNMNDTTSPCSWQPCLCEFNEKCEVIGNIHQNPELLK